MKLALSLVLAMFAATGDDETFVRLTVANFYKTPDGKTWNSGAWQATLAKGDATAKVRLVLEPQAKGEPRRDLKGEVDAKEFEKLFADLKKKGLLTATDPVPCACDAPFFRMAAQEGKTQHAFKFGHAHADHDRSQKALIDAVIGFVEKHAATPAEVKK